MNKNSEIVRGKIKWQSEEGDVGLIKDQRGRKIYFTREALISTPGAEQSMPSKGEAVQVLLKQGRRVNQDMLEADKVVSFGVELDDLD